MMLTKRLGNPECHSVKKFTNFTPFAQRGHNFDIFPTPDE